MYALLELAMGKGGWNDADHTSLPVYTWKEVGEHKERDDRWIVINGYIYDVTSWAKRHPGGEKIIGGYAGHDASVSMSYCCCIAYWCTEFCNDSVYLLSAQNL